jgi:hypothetical protein
VAITTTVVEATDTSSKVSEDGPTSKLPPPAALDSSAFDLDNQPVFNTAYFDVENVPGKSNTNVGISVDTRYKS